MKTVDQNVAVRTLGETDEVELIADTIIRTGSAAAGGPAGDLVRVRDVARVVDGLEDSDLRGRFNGRPAVDVTVYQTSKQDAIEIATRVKAFVAGKTRGASASGLADSAGSRTGCAAHLGTMLNKSLTPPG